MTKTEILKVSKYKSIIRKVPAIKDYVWEESGSGSVYYYHKSLSIGSGGKPNASFRISDHWNWTNKDGSIGCPVSGEDSMISDVCLGFYINGEYIIAELKTESDLAALKAITDMLNEQAKELTSSTRDKKKVTKKKTVKKPVMNQMTIPKSNLEYFNEYDDHIAFTINGNQCSWDKNGKTLCIYYKDTHGCAELPNTMIKFK